LQQKSAELKQIKSLVKRQNTAIKELEEADLNNKTKLQV